MAPSKDERVARICWNSRGWTIPSGPEGKSRGKESYEYKTGYGHEEWLLDLSKTLDGYHYSYLQAIGQHRKTYLDLGKQFKVHLYSIDSKRRERWWIGSLKNLTVVDQAESRIVFKEYKKRGWYDDMLQQLADVGADVKEFRANVPTDAFTCVKFRPEDVDLLPEPIRFSHTDPAIRATYYNLQGFHGLPKDVALATGFKFSPKISKTGATDSDVQVSYSYKRTRAESKICETLGGLLLANYDKNDVAQEQPTGIGTRIDFAVNGKLGFTFYEVKLGTNARDCVRQALGQLLEYGYFAEVKKIEKLVIVSSAKADQKVRDYLKYLRDSFHLPIYYMELGYRDEKLGPLI